jgi:replicative DNA helicase Mcm
MPPKKTNEGKSFTIEEGFQKYSKLKKEAYGFIRSKDILFLHLAIFYAFEKIGKGEAREILPFFPDRYNMFETAYDRSEHYIINQVSTLRVRGFLAAVDKEDKKNIIQLSYTGKEILQEFISLMESRLKNSEEIKTPAETLKMQIRRLIETDLKEHINSFIGRYPIENSVYLDYEQLERISLERDLQVAEALLKSPDDVFAMFREIITEQRIVIDIEGTEERTFQPNIRVRNISKEYRTSIPQIRPSMEGMMFAFEGVIIGRGSKFGKIAIARHVCTSCSCNVDMPQRSFTDFIEKPHRCPDCKRSEFRFEPGRVSDKVSFQKLEIQEPLEKVETGKQSQSIALCAIDDVVDKAEIGDNVVVIGILRFMPPKFKSALYSPFVEILSMDKTDQDIDINPTPEEIKQIKTLSHDKEIYEKIGASVAPSIYGYTDIKEAVALQLFGGRKDKRNAQGGRERSDIHILLVGDPSTGKSKLLRCATALAPKNMLASGKGTSGCGLTASVIKDEVNKDRWVFKAGAMPLANGGLLGIDEFDKMDKEDRQHMLDGMESQTIQLAKAGIMATIKTETTILAAANPIFSRFDQFKPIFTQFDLEPALLSRFDLIFVVFDEINSVTDRKIAKKVLDNHSYESGDAISKEDQPPIPHILLKKYIAYARKNVFPRLSIEAKNALEDLYVKIRGNSKGGMVPITTRQLEGLTRLAEARAKIRLSSKVTVDDVKRVFDIYMTNLKKIATDKETGEIDIDRIMTAHPSDIRAQIRILENIIRDLCGKDPHGEVAIETVLRRARERGIDDEDSRKIIGELKSKGSLYEPRKNTLKITN